MIEFESFSLPNGLRVLVSPDTATPFVAVNVLYDVGSKDEDPSLTGFAHLFEHLMFEGSVNIPNFDSPLQKVGGENNAYTNTDVTSYYITLPKENIETAFWLESDRMLGLDFSEEKLRIQKQVVIEEYKQRYLNRPYGDVWLLLRPLAYRSHPYQWATIGKDISHIERATLEQVRDFYYAHYAPNNAILSVSGNVTVDEVRALCDKWFAPIASRPVRFRSLPQEPAQTGARFQTVGRPVPFPSMYKVYRMGGRMSKDFYTADLVSDILSNGKASRLHQNLVQEKQIFSDAHAFLTGETEPGLFSISGNLRQGVSFEAAELAIEEELQKIREGFVFNHELLKVKNKTESSTLFAETNVLNKAMSLAKAELLGNANLANQDLELYKGVEISDIRTFAETVLVPSNCSTLYYQANQE